MKTLLLLLWYQHSQISLCLINMKQSPASERDLSNIRMQLIRVSPMLLACTDRLSQSTHHIISHFFHFSEIDRFVLCCFLRDLN
jgi:hypothetical protein